MFFNQRDLQTELNSYGEQAGFCSKLSKYVDKSAYTHARKKFTHQVYHELNSFLLSSSESHDLLQKRYHGFRVFAIDGTSLDLPNIELLDEYFGHYKNSVRDSSPRARVSLFYDCLNQVICDSIISPVKISEPVMAFDHLSELIYPKNL